MIANDSKFLHVFLIYVWLIVWLKVCAWLNVFRIASQFSTCLTVATATKLSSLITLLKRLQAVKINMGSNQETSGTQAGFEGFTADKLARDLMDLLERKIKKCNSHREREVLRYAQHLLQCNGCEKDRIHKNTGCINCREKKSRKWKRKSCLPAHFHCNRYFVPLFKCSDLKGKPLSIFRRKKTVATWQFFCYLAIWKFF